MSDTPTNNSVSGFTPEEQAAYDAMLADDGAGQQTFEASDAPAVQPGEGGQATETAPEPAAGEGDGAQDDVKTPTVPRGALHEERQKRKETEERLKQIERQAAEQRQEYERRFEKLLEVTRSVQGQQQPAQPQPQPEQLPPLPDPATDPVGHLVERNRRLEMQLQQLAQFVTQGYQQQQQTQQRQQYEQRLQTAASVAEAQFRAEHPDYQEAADFLAEHRHKELALSGVANAADRMEQIREEAKGLVAFAVSQNRSPAEIIYGLAQLRGWQPKAADAGQQQAQAQLPAPTAPAPAERIDQLRAGQEQARTTGNMRGAAPAPINTQTIMAMTPKEFDAWMSKATQAQKEAVFGS